MLHEYNYFSLYPEYFKNGAISSQDYNFNNYVFVVTDIIIFPGTCYVLVFSIQLALACARRNIWWEQLNLRSKFSYINERTNEIHISWFMLCAGVTFQLALVCARKYDSWVQLLKPLPKKYFKNHAISSQDHNFNNYVIVVTDVIIFPGTCYVLVSTIQLALACAWKDIWFVHLSCFWVNYKRLQLVVLFQ